jgi:hypothetical protein
MPWRGWSPFSPQYTDDSVEEVAALSGRQIQQAHRPDVHRGVGCLQVQEHPVEPAQGFHRQRL